MTHFLQYFYVPASGPWYSGNVWGNIVAVTILGPLGVWWAHVKFKALHVRMDRQHDHNEWMAGAMHELHVKTDGQAPSVEHPHFDL